MKFVRILIVLSVIMFVFSCKNSKIYSSKMDNRIVRAYNHLVMMEQLNHLVISDSLFSADIRMFRNELYPKHYEKYSENEYYDKLLEINKKFKIEKTEKYPLKRLLNNTKNDGDKVMYFSKIVDNFLVIKVYDLRDSIYSKFKNKRIYPYSSYYYKSPYSLYLFEFKSKNDYCVYKELVFWQ